MRTGGLKGHEIRGYFIKAEKAARQMAKQTTMTQADVSMAVAQAMTAALPELVEQTAKLVEKRPAASKRTSKSRSNEVDLPRLKAENTFKDVALRLETTPEALHRFAELLRLIYRHGETGEWLPTERGLRSKMLKVRNATYERGEDKPDGQASYAVLTRGGALYLESLVANETKLLPDIEARLSSGRRISNAMARIWQRDVMEGFNTQGELPLH
jgi:hypothetical protein